MKLSNKVYDVLKWIALYLLPALGTLTVGGKAIKDPVKYLADQKSAVELYNSMIGWFTSGDFDTLKVVLQQYGDAGALGDAALSYVNGWLMDAGAQWDHIRASLPADAKEVVMDETGIYYGQLVDGKRSLDAIVDDLAARFDAPREAIASDVHAMLQNLADKGAIRL